MQELLRVPFFYIRHGQTDWNVENRVMGQKDIPLNEYGKAQAMACREILLGCNIKTICHSPLTRARQTAEILNEILQCNLVEIEELKEFNLGEFEGKEKTEWFRDWRLGKNISGAETYFEFRSRCFIGINRALGNEGPVLIVSHGGVYWAIEYFAHIQPLHDLPNCVPVFYQPLEEGKNQWKASLLENSRKLESSEILPLNK